jgi:pyruvate,water dikinase
MNFGYLRESGNDFSTPTWFENPKIVIDMIRTFEPPQLIKYTMQETEELISETFGNSITRAFFDKSVKYQEYRESVNQLYMYGYGLFRPFFIRIAEKLVQKSQINEIEDIFYLSFNEIKNLISSELSPSEAHQRIQNRRNEMNKYKNIHLPSVLYDDNPPEPVEGIECFEELTGVPTSRGIYVGPVKVAKGIEDNNKIQEGDVLVIPFSDISWTPLFSKAKAVISESGGILSHASIVAREYKIPAIVSVEGVLNLKDGTIVVVDGFTGKISLVNQEKREDCE